MGGCTNKIIGSRLHAYEIGLLGPEEQEEFEIHLLECPYCQERVREFSRAAELIRNDTKTQRAIGVLAGEKPSAGKPRRHLLRIAVVAAAMVVLLLIRPWRLEFSPSEEAFAEENRLIITRFDNVAVPGDPDRTGEIIANLLITDLSQSQFIRVVTTQRLNDIMALLGDDAETVSDRETAMQAARRAGARWLLSGSIIQAEPRLVLTTQISEVSTGDIIASYKLTAEPGDDIFSLTDRLTVAVKGRLSLPLEAMDEFDPPIAEVTTHSPEAYRLYLIGVGHYYDYDRTEAAASFRKALEYDSTFAMAYYYLSNLEDSALIEKAVAYSKNASQRERYYILAREASVKGRTDDAIAILEELVKGYPDEKNAFYLLGVYQYNRGQYAVAVDYLDRAIAIDSLYAPVYNYLAYAYRGLGDIKGALAAVDRYIAAAPDEANPRDTRGEILAASGDLAGAIEAYRQAVEIKPDFSDYGAMLKLGRLYIFNGEYDNGRDCFQQVAIDGNRTARSYARLFMAVIPLYQGHFKEAAGLLTDGIAADRLEQATAGRFGTRSFKHFIRSYIYAEWGDYKAAIEDMREAIRVHNLVFSPKRPAFRCNLAQILAESGDLAGAEKIRQTLFDEYRAGAEIVASAYWYVDGCIKLKTGENKQAVASLEKSVLAMPDFDFQIKLAESYVAAGYTEKAIALYENTLGDYNPAFRVYRSISAVKAFYHLGLAYEQAGRTIDAIEQYERFLTIWADADPGIKEIADARKRLARLKTLM